MQLFTSIDYLRIDIANHFGLDKEDWDDRIEWVHANDRQLEALIEQAEEPALYYAAVSAYRKAVQGLPIGHMISLDATSSGLQLLACLTGDRSSAELCNVVNIGHRADAYTKIYREMLDRLGEDAKISRSGTKDAIMTSLYGSTAMPKQVFGEGALLATFFEVMEEKAPAAWDLNQYMLDLWNPDALSHDWVMPDNFHVKVKVMDQVKEVVHFLNEPFDVFHKVNMPMETGRSLCANTTHSLDSMVVREVTRRCDYDVSVVNKLYDLLQDGVVGSTSAQTLTEDDKLVVTLWDHYKNTGYLSARIMGHLNANNIGHVDPAIIWELLNSLPDKPFKVVSIHDCFRVHPNYGNDLRKQYNLQLSMIAKSDILSSLISQLLGKTVKIGKLDPDLWIDILETEYALS